MYLFLGLAVALGLLLVCYAMVMGVVASAALLTNAPFARLWEAILVRSPHRGWSAGMMVVGTAIVYLLMSGTASSLVNQHSDLPSSLDPSTGAQIGSRAGAR